MTREYLPLHPEAISDQPANLLIYGLKPGTDPPQIPKSDCTVSGIAEAKKEGVQDAGGSK